MVLDYGVKISDGDAAYVKNDPNVIAAYLGVDDEALKEEPVAAKVVAEAIGVDPSEVELTAPAAAEGTRSGNGGAA